MRDAEISNATSAIEPPAPSFSEALRTWAKIGLLSFGGPAAQIALMHRIIVEEKKWLDEQRYLNALSFCMLLPGPEAMQLATYAGWRLHGLAGGLAAGLLFVLPGAVVVLALSMIYASFGKVPIVEALFYGIKGAVLVIVVEALLRVSRRALKKPLHWAIAAASFVGIFFFDLPFPLIIAGVALFGFAMANDGGGGQHAAASNVNIARTLTVAATWAAIWVCPLLVIAAVFGPSHILSQIGWFFSKLAVVTFGGAYAVLAYMAQDVVQQKQWLEAGQMMDGLGLAETTPGPLILVTEFVGYVAAFRSGGMVTAVGGAIVALWATFAPCFLWIFTGAPYIEWIISKPRLRGALVAITAAVVGVILNLTVWFGMHVFFGQVSPQSTGWLRLWVPRLDSFDWRITIIALAAGFLLLRRHWGVAPVLAVTAALGVAARLSGI